MWADIYWRQNGHELVEENRTFDERLDYARQMSRAGDLPLGPTDWYYRTLVPKDMPGNLWFRDRVLTASYRDESLQEDLWIICRRDMLFWINVFGWTLDPLKHARQPVRPFITYPYQDRVLLELAGAIGKHDITLPKVRDMGASWMCLLAMKHCWQFFESQLFLLTSRKAEMVDGDEKALLPKVDWYMKRQPAWLRPRLGPNDRTKMHIHNPQTGSRFDGEATVSNLATGDRRTAILLDEAAHMPDFIQILSSTRDVTNCRMYNSTPNGRKGTGEGFYRQVRNPHVRRVFMHWTEHPLKNHGLYKLVDGNRVELDPATYRWQDDYDFDQLTFREKARSEWYDEQCKREFSPRNIATNLDLDFVGSTERFADEGLVSLHRTAHAQEPKHVGNLVYDEGTYEATWSERQDGRMRLWCEIDSTGLPPMGRYVLGVDVCRGSAGAYSSNTALVVLNMDTGEQVMRYAFNRIRPEETARLAYAVCLWFHEALLVTEIPGPGMDMLKEMETFYYWNMYRRRSEATLRPDKPSDSIGYANRDRGTAILSALQDAMTLNHVVIHDTMILDELLEYEYGADGKVDHSGSKASSAHSDAPGSHGDAAIACALAWEGIKSSNRIPKGKRQELQEPPRKEVPYGCLAWRLQQRKIESTIPDWKD